MSTPGSRAMRLVADGRLVWIMRELTGSRVNLCLGKRRVSAKFTAHNGKRANLKPIPRVPCGKSQRAAAKHQRAEPGHQAPSPQR